MPTEEPLRMPIDSPTRPIRLHIGHHFFGAGNLGDDLMLGGFLAALAARGHEIELSCACPFDLASQRRRFPQVRWLPYEPAAREAAIGGCDAWVGLGGTPFQIVVGPWFLDHLADELELCRKHGKPMYFIGIGVNEPEALEDPRAKQVLAFASRIWTRDERSAALIAAAGAGDKVVAAADLAHVYLRQRSASPVQRGVDGYVLNFEDERQFDPNALCNLVAGMNDRQQRWLVQEDRPLEGSERAILDALPSECRARLDVRVPPYADGSLDDLLATWGRPERLLTSRYHAAVVGAWSGARVVAVERSEKIRGLVTQLNIISIPRLSDPAVAARALARATSVDRDLLDSLARRADDSCGQLMDHVMAGMIRAQNRAELASVEAKDSPRFRSFMTMMNAFAAAFGLRTFTTWSKIWEYPWLWHAALGRIDWGGRHVIDLGSEISPMPWFLATLGAKVTLIEVDARWLPLWEQLRSKLDVDVSWHVVKSETIPVPTGSADVVTSFSVIEHQPNKRAAVDEVARVLKQGGVFAVSFDICEPQMGMTFPEWNGRALTLAEFEQTIWLHPAFGNTSQPVWNREAIEPFLAWHRTTAPHHNYVAGAAVLVKR